MNAPAHYFLPPSGAGYWVYCAQWPTMNAMYPQPDDPETLAGTAAHWVFAEQLYKRTVDAGAIAPNGVEVTDEMIEGAELLVDHVRAALAAIGGPVFGAHIETPVDCSSIHPLNKGTPDVWFYDVSGNVVHLVDYKFGHRYVDEYMNWQLIDYAAGILSDIQKRIGHIPPKLVFRMTVIQPRCYVKSPVRTWTISVDGLAYAWDKLCLAASLATGGAPTATPGPEQCRDCPGRHVCPALQQDAYDAASRGYHTSPLELPPHALGLELRLLRRAAVMLEARITGLEADALARLRGGVVVPFARLEQGQGRERWTVPVDQLVAMAKMCGLTADTVAPRKPATPGQTRRAGMPPELVAAISETPRGALKVVEDDGSAASKVFGC